MELLENAYIYCFKQGDKILYIGKTHQKIEQRLNQHLNHCHNDKLKKYLESDTPPIFEVVYESHNQITEEILCSIEQSYIETLKPECNILGVIKPYDYFKKKDININKVDSNPRKNCVTEEEINAIMNSNPQISECRLITIATMVFIVCPENINDTREQRRARHALDVYYGKLNDFNKRDYFNQATGAFQQKTWCVQDKEYNVRPLTWEEKYGNKKIGEDEKIIQGRLLFSYWSDEEYENKLIDYTLAMLDMDDNDPKKKLDYQLDCMRLQAYFEDPDHLKKYYPLKVIINSDGVILADTLFESIFCKEA